MIEDEFLVATEIQYHLQRGGFTDVAHVATEKDALAAIADRNWDAAVVDANLNGRGIGTIAAALLQKNVPFVIVTGYARESLPASVAHVAVIYKPFHSKNLLDAVKGLFRDDVGR